MAALKYYRKHVPDSPVVLSTNTRVKFTSIDGLVGYFSTDREDVQREFSIMMSQQRGGIVEIDEATYNSDFIQKKTESPESLPVWRDEMQKGRPQGRSLLQGLQPGEVESVVGVKTTDIRRDPIITMGDDAAVRPAAPHPSATAPVKGFEPPVGQRKRRAE